MGGQVTELLVTDVTLVQVRATSDVDVVVSVSTRVSYRRFEERLVGLGFRQDTSEGAPLCRWSTPSGETVDVMSSEAQILGFSNRWYAAALDTSRPFQLADDLTIRIPSSPVFLATKLEAWKDRGGNDPMSSWDLGDVISVVAGRPELPGEVNEAPRGIRRWLARSFDSLLAHSDIEYAISGTLRYSAPSPEALDLVLNRMRSIRDLLTDPPDS